MAECGASVVPTAGKAGGPALHGELRVDTGWPRAPLQARSKAGQSTLGEVSVAVWVW